MRLRVMTFNIQSGRDAFGRLDISASEREIRKHAPDICALNEVRMGSRDVDGMEQARELARRLDMRWAFSKAIDYMGGEYGVALLSRFPILQTERTPVPGVPEDERDARYEPRTFLKCVLNANGREICACTSHYGLSRAEQRRAVSLTLEKAGEEARPLLFMGDLNMTPDDPFIAELSQALSDTAADGRCFTFRAGNLTCKIDYIFASAQFKALSARAPASAASDHLPYLAELEL